MADETRTPVGILSASVYMPRHRLDRAAIAGVLGGRGGRGTRTVAGYDEDSTSMGVEAARAAVGDASVSPEMVLFATTTPAYADKTNATAIHAALGLDRSVAAYDTIGSVRSAVAALRLGLQSAQPTLVVGADLRVGLPSGPDESDQGDGAAALMVGPGPGVVAELVATASASAEFLDRWRAPTARASRVWEERFGETVYGPLATTVVEQALTQAGLSLTDVDRAVVTGAHRRAVRGISSALPGPGEDAADLAGSVGFLGAADLGARLADVLDRSTPGQIMLALCLSDGADAFVFRTTEAINGRTPKRTVAQSVAGPTRPVSYGDFLTWRGLLDREPPRRPEPEAPAAPPAQRAVDWKFGFCGSRCTSCQAVHLPPQRICVSCGAADKMEAEPLSDQGATIATFTVDHLTFSLSPPVVAVVVDFDGGGRFACEMTDVDPDSVAIGDPVELTFRRLSTAANGVHNYFWKARPKEDG